MHRPGAFANAPVGVFDHHYGPIHQHPDRQYQAEHHDVRDRNSHDRQKRETQQERGRYRKADQQRGPCAKRDQNHDHHQRDGGQHRALELAHHAVDNDRLVHRKPDRDHIAQLGRPKINLGLDRFAHQCGGVDQVEPFALDHLQRNRRFAVEPCRSGPVLKGQANVGQIAQGDHAVAVGLDWQVIDILRLVERRWYLDRKRALRAVDLARRDQLVVVDDNGDQLASGDVIGFQPQRVDDHFKHFVAVPGQNRLEHRVHAFNSVLQFFGHFQQSAFRDRAGQIYDDDREFGKIDLVDRIFLGTAWKFCLDRVHPVAHIGQNLGLVPAKFKL